ncbi:DUF2867 domain-containing protein [Nocardioides sp. GCM10027113]|uniref:DUF2867 domain-containing protein n=1 Tax=unclassified Nocardioides TaxID=2615069 RepID=UPI00361197AE
MLTRPDLRESHRTSVLDRSLDEVWDVVASGWAGRQWYVDALPFVFRGAVDRVVGGPGRRWQPPGTPLLRHGDLAGFWRVTRAEHDGPRRLLLLEAQVRAPGTVRLLTTAQAVEEAVDGAVENAAGPPEAHGRTRLVQTVELEPHGLLGTAYLLADIPAREAVVELTHRRLLADLRA